MHYLLGGHKNTRHCRLIAFPSEEGVGHRSILLESVLLRLWPSSLARTAVGPIHSFISFHFHHWTIARRHEPLGGPPQFCGPLLVARRSLGVQTPSVPLGPVCPKRMGIRHVLGLIGRGPGCPGGPSGGTRRGGDLPLAHGVAAPLGTRFLGFQRSDIVVYSTMVRLVSQLYLSLVRIPNGPYQSTGPLVGCGGARHWIGRLGDLVATRFAGR